MASSIVSDPRSFTSRLAVTIIIKSAVARISDALNYSNGVAIVVVVAVFLSATEMLARPCNVDLAKEPIAVVVVEVVDLHLLGSTFIRLRRCHHRKGKECHN